MKVITTNFHVPYLSMLSRIPNINMVVFSYRFQGRDWQNFYRAKPKNVLHIPIDEVPVFYMTLSALLINEIDYIILHSKTDLELFCDSEKVPKVIYEKLKSIPKYYVFHNSIFTEYRGAPEQVWNSERQRLTKIFQENNIKGVCISKWKAEGWQLPCHIIPPGIDTADFPRSWTGANTSFKFNDSFPNYSIRVCSNFEYRDFMNGYRNSNQVLSAIKYPNVILGEGNNNTQEKIPQALFAISNSFEHYKQCMTNARLMLSSNIWQYEDWYNLSSLEAIALGVPIVFITHDRMTDIPNFTKTFPLVSEDMGYLQEKINQLFKDETFAQYISQKQMGFIEQYFSLSAFLSNWGALLTKEVKK